MSAVSLAHLLARSLLYRRGRSLSALLALTVSAGILTTLLTLYADLDGKLHREFRSFGANLLVTAPSGRSLPANAAQEAQQIAGVDARVVPFAYAVVTTDRHAAVVLAGTDLAAARHLNTWWSVQDAAASSDPGPAPPSGSEPGAALLGSRAAAALAEKSPFQLTYNNRVASFRSVGSLHTGGDEDSRIYTSLEAFTFLTGSGPTVLEIQIPGSRSHIESTLSALQQNFPGLTVAPVRQLVEGESRIVDRTRALMFGALLLVAFTVAISVLATLSASVLERRRDFALIKALGGSERFLATQFLLETVALSLAGVLAGFILGSAFAWVIGRLNFGTSTLPRVQTVPLVLLFNLVIAAAAALLPTRSLRLLQPAALLKGE